MKQTEQRKLDLVELSLEENLAFCCKAATRNSTLLICQCGCESTMLTCKDHFSMYHHRGWERFNRDMYFSKNIKRTNVKL